MDIYSEIRSGKKVYEGREILNIPQLQLDKGIYWLGHGVIISRLTPAYLRPADALLFGFLGYGLLLLLNSLLFIKPFGKKQYLKIVVVIFFILFAGIVTGTMIWLTMLSFLFSIYLFFSRYYRYESV